jgi:Domain of unknown function (DUF4375)
LNSERSYWTLIEPHRDRVSIYDGPGAFLQEFKATPEPSRHLLAAHWCQSEICNGGFEQFFFNSTGVLAPEAVEGFHAIGLHVVASVVQQAMELLGAEYPRDREVRNEILDAVKDASNSNAFDSLDEEFFKLIRTENGGWDEAANKYAATHGGPLTV